MSPPPCDCAQRCKEDGTPTPSKEKPDRPCLRTKLKIGLKERIQVACRKTVILLLIVGLQLRLSPQQDEKQRSEST